MNVCGQGLPLLASLAAVPVLLGGLGPERFGLYSFAWVVLGYASLFELGVGRATTRLVAEALATGRAGEVSRVVATAVTVQAAAGTAGGLCVAAGAPLLIRSIPGLPDDVAVEARWVFLAIALAVPVTVLATSLAGVLEAMQRFDLVNAVRIPAGIAHALLPVVGLLSGATLPWLVALALAPRGAALVAFAALVGRRCPSAGPQPASASPLPALLSYSGWVTGVQLIVPVFVYLDRFLVGALLGASALAWYAAPWELAARLLIVSSAVAGVLFPAFTRLAAQHAVDELAAAATRPLKYILTAMTPAALGLFLFADDVLGLWLGAAFVPESAAVLRLLAIAVVLNAAGDIPFTLLHAVGRPDVVVKYHLVELPCYGAVAWALTAERGVEGMAAATLARMLWTIPIFSVVAVAVAGIPRAALRRSGVHRSVLATGAVFAVAALARVLAGASLPAMALTAVVLVAAYVAVTWSLVFDARDRVLVKAAAGGRSVHAAEFPCRT